MIETLGSLLLASGHESPSRMVRSHSESPENPRVPLGRWWGYGENTSAGVPISPETALGIAPWYRAFSIISDNVADTPLHTFRRLEDANRERARDHYAYSLLTVRANNLMTARRWKKMMTGWVLGWGNAFSAIEMSANGRVTALWPIHPMFVRWSSDDQVYLVQTTNGPKVISPDFMLHLRGVEIDGSNMGKSVVTLARESLGMAVAQEKFGSSFYGQGATMSGFFTVPESLGDEAKMDMIKYIKAEYTGSSNWRKIGVLDGGSKFEKLQINPVDAQFLESRVFSVREVSRWTGVPPHMLADLDGAKYGNLGEQDIGFTRHTMRSYYNLFASEINNTLFSVAEAQRVFVEFEQNAILQAAPREQADVFNIYRQNGVFSANDIRRFLNMNPIEGPEGDAYVVNGNMVNPAKQGIAPQTNKEVTV